MPRPLSAPQLAAIAGETVVPVFLVELDFPSGFARAASTPFPLLFDSNGDTVEETFPGVGDAGALSVLDETVELQAHRVQLTLSGIKTANRSLALTENYRNRPARIWRGYLDADEQLIGDPVPWFIGVMDTLDIEIDPGSAAGGRVVVDCVSRFARWEQPVDAPTYADEDHQFRFPGDKFFQFVPQLVAGKEIIWGRS